MKKQPTKKQIRKKLKRAAIAKERVLARRDDLRSKAKKKREIEKIEREHRHRQRPIMTRKDAALVSRLEHNAQILKVLKEEMEREKNMRNKLNADLEKKGCDTLQKKLDYMGIKVETEQTLKGKLDCLEGEGDAES